MTDGGTHVPFGAIFDWDGVIIDSAALHERSWHALAADLGTAVAPGSFLRGFGMRNEQIIPEVHGWSRDPAEIAQLSERKEELYRSFVRGSGIVPLPGVLPWIETLANAGIPRVVASSTHRLNIEIILEELGLAGAFTAIVSAEDVRHGKPHPEVFLVGAARIGLLPRRCVVFEDAHVGLKAARAAGMRVVAVTTTNRAAELSEADLVVDRLDELTLERVEELLATAAPNLA